MMARWRYLEQWKETFPFVLRSAFSFWNRVLAFGQHFVLGGKYVNDRLPMESLFTTLPRVHAPSLTKDQSDLANPSRGHRNLIKLKAAHSPRRRSGSASTEAERCLEEGGKKSLLLYAPCAKGKPEELLCVMFPREGLLKQEMLKTLKTLWYNLPACSRAGYLLSHMSR